MKLAGTTVPDEKLTWQPTRIVRLANSVDTVDAYGRCVDTVIDPGASAGAPEPQLEATDTHLVELVEQGERSGRYEPGDLEDPAHVRQRDRGLVDDVVAEVRRLRSPLNRPSRTTHHRPGPTGVVHLYPVHHTAKGMAPARQSRVGTSGARD